MKRLLLLVQMMCIFTTICHAQFFLDYDSSESLFKQGMRQYNNAKYEDAFNLFAKSHNAGYPEASYMAGECLYQGLGTDEDKQLAFKIWLNAAEAGNANC